MKRIYEGRVLSRQRYYFPTRTRFLGKNCDFPDYEGTTSFSFSKFLSGLEGKRIRLTLETLAKKEARK